MTAPTVLVVEDNPLARKLLRVTLESRGYRVREAADGAAALAALKEPPALILQDLLLPDIDGLELRRLIGEQPGCADVPVVAVSGHASQLASGLADEAGFAARLRKPVEPSRLISALQGLLPPAVGGASVLGRRVLVVDDTAIQRKLAVLRLEDAGYEVLEAADGEAALRIARRERPDLVLSDVLMPGLDGFELCRALRADPGLAGTPVILASSVFVERADRELADRAGASAYVTREPDLSSILAVMARVLVRSTPAAAADPGFDGLHAERVGRALVRQDADRRAMQEELDERDAQLAVLTGLSQTLARTGDAEAVMEDLLARCLEATGVGGARYQAGGAGSSAAPGVVVGDPPAVAEAAVAAAAASDRPIVCDDGLVIGLRSGEQALGVVVLGNRGVPLTAAQIRVCTAIARQLGQAVAVARGQDELRHSRERTVERLAAAVALRDGATGAHTQRMSAICGVLARAAGLPAARCELIRIASAMHDIGKVATPDAILHKPGPLTDAERAEINRHAEIGHAILAGSGSELLEVAAEIALSHHEHWDGGGYPRGLSGADIPLAGRIAALADVFDALTSDRPYRHALPVADALAIMGAGRGTHFDPALLDRFVASIDAVLALA